MLISPVNNYQSNLYLLTFGVNLQSKKLRFKNDDFFVKIRGYGTNSDWAKKVIETADNAVKFIRTNCNFEETLKRITLGVTEANQFPLDLNKRNHTGILRIKRSGWRYDSDWKDGWGLITRYSGIKKNKYKTYADKLDYVTEHPLKNPYNDIQLTRPRTDKDYYGKFIDHADKQYINNAFMHIEKIYDNIYFNYILKEAKSENLNDINNSIAEIRWILAHATPWERGSDAISNGSIYKSIGIKASPLKRGISLDLEAYCTNLEDYKKNFSLYFAHKPYIVE